MVDLRPDQLATVHAILQAEVSECEVWAFGSRAKWTAKDSSDLDLALVSSARLPSSKLGRLREAFTDSYLPIKVDVVDIHRVSDEFRKIIESQKVVLQKPIGAESAQTARGKWQTLPLDECLETLIDYRGKTPTKVSSGIPLITAKVVKNGRIETPDEFIAEEDYEGWMRRGFPQAGDVLLTMEAPLGEVAQLDDRKVALAQRLVALRGKQGLLDNRYFKYLLQSDLVQAQLRSRATGTTVLGIKQSELRKINLTLPPLNEQRAMAQVLGTLDDKIELNRRMNETLEALAQSLFKSWFVDATQSALPEGWRESRLDESAVISGGKQLPTEECKPSGKFTVFGANGIMGYADRSTHEGFVIAFGRVGAYCGSIHWAYRGAWINNNASAVVPHRWPEFVLQAMLNIDFAAMRTGSAQPFIPNSALAAAQVVRPPDKMLDSYCSVVRPLRLKQTTLEEESRTLAALRDALLPKLLSGELRVPAAKLTEAHA